ncbi:hypothetical protein SJ05684_c00290 [Sinorhizobium sojae CCBAU 05684]|uniref:Uncharacterized protein n=1 Tax=Sinorhizobium sojae CCBAU 05684 TaxID=716928 RepID=A0A249P6Y8_9HYPH|nr:hypothetical protein SJ05684_c00290 [Sinorhizobium sojae CCBAU 05684]
MRKRSCMGSDRDVAEAGNMQLFKHYRVLSKKVTRRCIAFLPVDGQENHPAPASPVQRLASSFFNA